MPTMRMSGRLFGISLAVHLLHHLVMIGRRAGDRRFVLLGRHLRQRSDERDHVPDEIVVVCLAPSWHRTELHAVLDDPELLRGGAAIRLRELGGGWIQTLTHLRSLKSRPEMTTSAHFIVEPSARRDPLRTIEIGGRNDLARVVGDG